MKKFRRWTPLTSLLVLLLSAPGMSSAQAQEATDLSSSERFARELIMAMAGNLAGQAAFSVSLMAGYDVVQDDGQKIQFLESREILLSRPNHFRALDESANGLGSQILFDGEEVIVWHRETGVFAVADQPGSIDDALVYFERDLGMRMPLAGVFSTRFASELARRIQSIDFVETSNALGQPTHHLAARTADLDFQVWITDGDQPVPLRIVLTYPDAGSPQFWADFKNWSMNPAISEDAFEFAIPDGANQVPFAVQIPGSPSDTADDGNP